MVFKLAGTLPQGDLKKWIPYTVWSLDLRLANISAGTDLGIWIFGW